MHLSKIERIRWVAALTSTCFVLFLGCNARAEEPLEKKVPPITFESLPDAIKKLAAVTGLKVECPKDTSDVIQKFWAQGRYPNTTLFPKDTAKGLIDKISFDFGLDWKFDSPDETVNLDLAWREVDPRPAGELLRFVMEQANPPFLGEDAKWRAAFCALLCKEANFAKGAPLFQRTLLESFVKFPNKPFKLNHLMSAPVVSFSGEKYRVIFFNHPMIVSPGHGSISYYWFQEDGTLVGVGQMNTGHRCRLLDASVHSQVPGDPSSPSEIRFVVQHNNGIGPYVATFILTAEGLHRMSVSEMDGKPAKVELGAGESILPPERK